MEVKPPTRVESGLRLQFQQHREALLRFLVARCGDRAESEDILQDVWLRLETLQTAPIANGKSYLFRMAKNLALDRARDKRRREARDRDWTTTTFECGPDATEAADLSDNAEASLIKSEDAARLAHAISTLPPGAARALRLHKFEGLSHGEVAARLGISRSGVEKHIAVAMAHLRRAFGRD